MYARARWIWPSCCMRNLFFVNEKIADHRREVHVRCVLCADVRQSEPVKMEVCQPEVESVSRLSPRGPCRCAAGRTKRIVRHYHCRTCNMSSPHRFRIILHEQKVHANSPHTNQSVTCSTNSATPTTETEVLVDLKRSVLPGAPSTETKEDCDTSGCHRDATVAAAELDNGEPLVW